jgi:hypothetical protein
LSTFGQWKKFKRKWEPELRIAGVDWFHMSAYESRLSEYRDWPDAKRIGVLKRLHRIIKDHTMHGVTVSVNCAAYDKIMTPEWKAIYGKTYYGFDVRMIMKYLAEWADEENIPGPIHYVFAELRGQGNELDKIFRYLLKEPNTKKWFRLTGMWSKGLMRDVVQLQAADIIAYELNKRTVNEIGINPRFVRSSLNNLGRGLYQSRLAPLYFGESELLKLQRETLKGGPPR